MRNTKSLEIKVGIVSVVAIVLLILGISIGSDLNIKPDAKTLKIKFPNSSGIKTSSAVSINGVENGIIKSIESTEGGVIIETLIDPGFDLREDASAIILLKEITGGKKIEINPGNSPNKYNYNNILIGQSSADIGDLVAVLGSVSGDVVSLLRRLDTMSIAINELIQDKEFISSVKNSVTNLDSLVVSAREIIDRNKGKINSTMDDIADIADNTNDLIGNNKEKINKLINDLDAISTDLNQLLKNADITVKDFTNILRDVQKITDDINSKESTIGKLIRDEDFANRLDSAFSNLKNLLNQFEKHGVNVNVRLGTRP